MAATTTPRAVRRLRMLGLLAWGLALATGSIIDLSAPAQADIGTSGGDLAVAQTLAGDEVTVVLRRMTSVPGPLLVEVITHRGNTLRAVDVATLQDGAITSKGSTSRGRILLPRTPGPSSTTLSVDQPGAWTLQLQAGGATATIPFVVPAAVTAPAEQAVYLGFVSAGACLVLALVVAVRARRGWWAALPVGGVTAGVAVAVTAAVLSAATPLPPQAGTALDPTVQNVSDPYGSSGPRISDYSRPAAQLTVATSPGRGASQGTHLVLHLLDSATGIPVDDLVVHDDAFIHLLVVGPDGTLRHVHPVRMSAGTWGVDLARTAPGHYALSAEFERRGGGMELTRSLSGFDVAGHLGSAACRAATIGRSTPSATVEVGGSHWRVAASGLIAGAPTTLTATAPAADLQLWLGMAGHAIIAGPLGDGPVTGAAVQTAESLSHTHSMGAMSAMAPTTSARTGMGGTAGMSRNGQTTGPGVMNAMAPVNGDSSPDETVASYGPAVPFTYTFMSPGRYRVWVQVEEGYRITAIPVNVQISRTGS